tara:strand:- start:614 stop:1543 length:930 start_codon:yes stop_codon:yes gene_type:complete
MKTFFRILGDKLYGIQREYLGFDISDPSYIIDRYLDNQEFLVMRTCHGIGDWVLLSSMPRLLKEKYPNCKVYLPSKKLLQKIFGDMLKNWGYGTFDASDTVNIIFKNNPYVDGFVDEFELEVFHDHYKIFDPDNDEVPLIKQMLKFWQFKDEEMKDTTPDFYPTDDELEWFDNFNKYDKYGYILASSSFENGDPVENLLSMVKEHNWIKNWYYYGEVELQKSLFKFLEKDNVVEVKPLNLTIRQQQLLKSKAEVNFGNETGMSLWTSKYSKSYVLGHKTYTAVHGNKTKDKKRKRPFKTGNFVDGIHYL